MRGGLKSEEKGKEETYISVTAFIAVPSRTEPRSQFYRNRNEHIVLIHCRYFTHVTLMVLLFNGIFHQS